MLTIPENAKVIEFPTSTVWFDDDGILWSISKKAPQPTMEESLLQLEEFKKLTGGKKLCMLADVTQSVETNREMREFAAEELPKIIKAIAMVSDSAMGKMLANLFFNLKKQPYPVKMFNSVEEAHKWLKQYV
jgi:hypothetical protein